MKLSINGSEHSALCQIAQLREGFSQLGHQHVFDITDPDIAFVFVGNSPYDSWSHMARAKIKKTIFNVLDCPKHLPEWPQMAAKWPEQLNSASRVTCISKTVQRDLSDIGVRADVIYYPMKPVFYTGVRKYPQFRAAMIGRLRDPGKRASMGIGGLIRAGFNESEVAMIGPEYPSWGTNMSVTSDSTLNDIYNSVDYVLMTSVFEGLGLPALEAACCGAIPIIAPDLTTFDEFWAESPLGLHYQKLNSPNDVATLIRSLEDDPKWKTEVKQDILQYAAQKFRPKFEAKAVAQRILDIHLSL